MTEPNSKGVKMNKLICKNCQHLRRERIGEMSRSYYCGISPNRDKPIGIYVWKEKPHPKCPLKKGNRKE